MCQTYSHRQEISANNTLLSRSQQNRPSGMSQHIVNCEARAWIPLFLLHLLLFLPSNVDADDGDSLRLIRDKLRIANPAALPEWDAPSSCGGQRVNCSVNGTVIGLDLSNLQLHGQIPSEIGLLRNLEYLHLTFNYLSGNLPLEITELITLQDLRIDNNFLSGPLPAEIGNLTNLRYLMAGNNSFEGQIPPEIGSLVALRRLSLHNNRFTGAFPPEIGLLRDLETLKLHRNSIFSNIPEEVGKLDKLETLMLTDNQLIGGLPESLRGLTNIQQLKIDENNLSGMVPEFMGQLKNLQSLHMGRNYFTGPLPKGLETKSLWASHNYFNGTFALSTGTRSVVNNCLENETSQRPKEDCDDFYHNRSIAGCKLCVDWLYLDLDTCNCLFPIEVKLRSLDPLPSSNNLVQEVASGLNTTADKIIHRTWLSENQTVVFWILPPKHDRFSHRKEEELRYLFSSQSVTLKTFGPYELVELLNRQEWVEKAPPSKSPGLTVIPKPSMEKGGLRTFHLVMIVISGSIVIGIFLLLLGFFVIRHWKSWRKRHKSFTRTRCSSMRNSATAGCEGTSDGGGFQPPHPYLLAELEKLTNSWSPDKEIGSGAFGKVYHAVTDTGQEVAIKRGRNCSRIRKEQFHNEVAVLSRVHHVNLLRLLGYCEEGEEEILIYEYMSNGSLSDHLQGKDGETLSWHKRLQIALETARGLDYLHSCSDPAIIHRDVKPSNILLDKDMSVKVADFGISKLLDVNDTTVSTRVAGTIGYLDPVFLATQKLTRSSDVYSFGMVLLELITGQMCPAYMKSNPEIPMSELALNKFNRGGIDAILDPKLQSSVCPKEALTMLAKVVFLCVKEKRQLRPVMRDVVQGIENSLVKARNEMEVENSGSLSHISSSSDLIDIEALERRFHAGVHVDTILLCPVPEMTRRNSGNSGTLTVCNSGCLTHQLSRHWDPLAQKNIPKDTDSSSPEPSGCLSRQLSRHWDPLAPKNIPKDTDSSSPEPPGLYKESSLTTLL